MAYTYSKHEWQTQEPITAQKMNDIETGIENLSNDVVTSYYNKTQIDDKVTAINDSVSTVRAIANSATTGSTDGTNALNQIKDATINNTPSYTTLSERFTAISGKSDTAYDRATATQIEVVNARFNRASLSAKIAEMDTATTTLGQSITGAQDELTAARDGETTLSAKINSIDDKIEALETEIKAGDNTTTLTEKITAIKSDITTDKTDISNIKATIGAPISSNPDKTIRQLITDNATNAQTYTNTQLSNAKVDEIIGAHRDDNDTLDARFDDIEDDITTHSGQLTTIEGQINTLNTSVGNNTSNIEDLQEEIENAHTQTNTTLASRFAAIDTSIAELLNKSSTIVISQEDFDELQQGDSNIDYIVGPDNKGKYYYWKWINQSWNLISGGGGSGNASSLIFETFVSFENATKDENTDYYVKDANGYYAHYRYKNDNGVYTRFEIKQDAYTTSQTYSKNEVYTKSETTDAIAAAIATIDKDEYSLTYGTTPYGQDQIETENVLTLYKRESGAVEGVPVSQVIIAGGGGGGTISGATITLNRITQSPIIITPTDTALVTVEYSCVDDNVEITGYYTWSKGNQTLLTGTLTQGENTFDLTPFCSVGTQRLKLSVTNENGTAAPPKYWDIQMVDVRIESVFNDKTVYSGADYVNFTYTPYGAINKTVHIKLDGNEVAAINTTASGTSLSYSITPQAHGAHLVEAYITATINNKYIETNHIYKDIIWAHSGIDTPIIGCIYRYDFYGVINIKQYNSFSIPYYVYDPRSSTPTITLNENEVMVNTLKLSSAQNVWAYKSNEITAIYTEKEEPINADLINLYEKVEEDQYILTKDTQIDSNKTYYIKTLNPNTLTIACRNASVKIKVNVEDLGYRIKPVTTNLAFDFNPSGYSNGDVIHRLWSYTAENNKTTSLTVSDNFDWNNGGYQLDAEGNTYFCIKAGTRAYIDYKLFENDSRISGAEFKIIFKTTNVANIKASFLRCLTSNEIDNVGLEMCAHEAYLKTSADILYVPYSEEDVIEFEYNINPIDTQNLTASSYIMSYEDGVGARPLIYDNDTRLYQYLPASIIEIGSNDCDVWIYRMKAYTSALTDVDILNNFYADARSSDEMIARFQRNQIYDENNKLTPESVAEACRDLRVIMIDAPYFTNDKKDYVKDTTVTCIYKNGRPRDNWVWKNGFHVGQGTSSNRYGAAGRNIDIIFGFDGEHTVVNKIKENTVQGYVSQITFADGTVLEGAAAKMNLTDNSIENSWFNIKVNIASSENANNALLQKRFNDYIPYKTPGQKKDQRIKNSMEFQNCVIFVRENSDDITQHREFMDTEYHFYGIGNLGDSKKTDNTRVNDPTDMKEFVVEISDNNLPNAMFQTGVYWTDDTHTSTSYDPSLGMGLMKYPITEEEWNNENNLARKALSLEGYVSGQKLNEDTGEMEDVITNWDSSFEFRYDIGTKDGESFPGLEEQQELSKLKWNEMYKWVITCPDNKFAEELGNWFIVESPLYWYLFTERYTMIDNRAKNSFWHYGKTYITEAEAEEMGADAVYYTVNNAAAAINQGYRFDLWNYDDDTALGIDNSGILNITYGKEDIDFIEGTNTPLYNAGRSIFWRRIRNLMSAQLQTMYSSTVTRTAWNALSLINEFDNWQNQFPEELWRLDIERKYIRPYEIGSWDQTNQVYKKDKTFLEGMANGRKRYQRRQFERDMEIYIATKYMQAAILEDTIDLRLGVPSAESAAVVPANYTLNITPYSDMYIRVMFGNTSPTSRRAKAGVAYNISPPLNIDDPNTLQISIYAASRIQALNDLSACYIRDNNFSRASKLKTLIIGNTTQGYSNNVIESIGIGDNPLLEVLNITNCPNLTGTLNLTNCKNLISLYAANTALTTINFATGGKITTAILPDTLNSLAFRSLKSLSNLSIAGYNRLTSFICEDSNIINPLNIVSESINTLQTIRITDLAWTLNNINILKNIYNKSNSLLTGLTTITGEIKREDIIKFNEKWPDLILNTDNAQITEQFEITFQYTDISGNQHVFKEYVEEGQIAPDPMTAGLLDPVPGKPSETEVDYIFGEWRQGTNGQMVYQEFSGWKTRSGAQMQAVGASSNMTYIAVYNTTPRKYSVEWYVDNVKVDNTTTDYGGEAITEYIPANKWDSSTNSAKVFIGWDKSTGEVKENMVGPKRINAKWLEGTVPTAEELQQGGLNSLNEAQLYALSKIDQLERDALLGGVNGYVGDYKDFTLGHDYEFDNVESNTFIEEDTILGYNVNVSLDTPDERTIKVYDNQVHYNNQLPDIRPLSSSDGFTLVLDYNIYKGVNRSYVMSCYQDVNNTEKGFQMQVINGTEIAIIWGGNYANRQTVNTVGNRGIIVLRKPKNSNDLKLYYDNSTGLTPNITTSTFYGEGEGNIINVPLVLGSYAIVNPDTGAVTLPGDKSIAKGIIHWGKYWNADLGDNICRKLASSCHEKIRFRLQGYNDANANNLYKVYEDSTNGARSVNLSFIATKPLEKNYLYTNSSYDPTGATNGWQDFDLRTICNNKIYNSMPVALKSIIADTPTRCFGRILAQEGDNIYTNQYIYGKTTVLDDYIYIPTYYELKGTNTMEPYPEGIRHPIPWITTKTIYTESGISNSSIDISRIMFKYKSIPTNAHYFNYSISSNPYNRSNELSNITVNSGDVWVPSGGSSNTAAYMYVTQDEVNKYNLTIEQGAYFACANGGWIKSTTYWTRTINYQSIYPEASYYYVQERGSVEQDSQGTNSTNNSVIIQFSI